MNNIPKENLKRIKEFTLFDDLYMNVFFKDNLEGVQFILRLILDKKDLIVESVAIQEYFIDLESKTSRLDVSAKDKENNRYNIEFQVIVSPELIRRGRFYLSKIDTAMLKPGKEYHTLPETYVIFVSKGDVIGKDRPYHHFTMKDEEGYELKDGHHLLFLNADYPKGWRLKELMDDFNCADPDQMRYTILKERAKYFKEEEEGIMYLNPNLQKMVDNAQTQTIRKIIISLLKEKSSFDFISKVTEASVDDIQKIQQEMNVQKKQ